jgi:hypothetical protein
MSYAQSQASAVDIWAFPMLALPHKLSRVRKRLASTLAVHHHHEVAAFRFQRYRVIVKQ